MALLPPPIGYDDDHEAFRDSVRRFAAASVEPRLKEFRSTGGFPRDLISELGEQGFLGISIPEEFGGGGADPRFDAVLLHELMRVGAAGLALTLAGHLGAGAAAVLGLPDGERRDALLEGMVSGEVLVVPAVVDGEGRAFGVTGAPLADAFVVISGDEVSVVEQVSISTVAGLGGRDAAAGDISVDLGPVAPDGDAAPVLVAVDLWASVLSVAGAWAALDLTVDYVNDRKVFGQPVAAFENTRFRLAEVGSQISVAEAFVESCLDEAAAHGLSCERAAIARLISGDAHDRAVDQGMQLHGGYGYMREYAISTAFADARFLRLAASATGDRRPLLATAVGL